MSTKLIGLQYKLLYKKGSDNGVADALSRRLHDDSQLMAVSACTPNWIDEVTASYSSDSAATALIEKLSVNASAVQHFTFVNGILRYKSRIWVGNSCSTH